ncbi:MAG: lipopolysaccharide biosynthesis protein, partial [Bacteroidota bacterium]
MIKSTFKKLRGNQLAKSVVFYTILGFFVKGISFLITPLFTHYIEPGDFGNLNLYLSTINFITPIILASTNSINSDYFKISKEELSKRISSYWIFSVFLSGALTLLVLIFSNKLTHFFSFNTFYIAMLPLMCICTLMIDTGFIVFRNENKNKSISLYTILKIVIEMGLSLIFIVYYKHGVIGRLNAFIISNLVLGAFLFVFTNRHFKLKLAFNSNHIKNE